MRKKAGRDVGFTVGWFEGGVSGGLGPRRDFEVEMRVLAPARDPRRRLFSPLPSSSILRAISGVAAGIDDGIPPNVTCCSHVNAGGDWLAI